jgi:hypothetical protein
MAKERFENSLMAICQTGWKRLATKYNSHRVGAG